MFKEYMKRLFNEFFLEKQKEIEEKCNLDFAKKIEMFKFEKGYFYLIFIGLPEKDYKDLQSAVANIDRVVTEMGKRGFELSIVFLQSENLQISVMKAK